MTHDAVDADRFSKITGTATTSSARNARSGLSSSVLGTRRNMTFEEAMQRVSVTPTFIHHSSKFIHHRAPKHFKE
jgi:hypothetical protein